jgi:diguanylate cyclase (GGDEF) domain
MHNLLYIEMNAFAIIILFLIYLNIYHRTDKHFVEQKLFHIIIWLNINILVFDTFMWLFDGINTPLFRFLLPLSTFIYFLFQPIICMLWSLYLDFQINRSTSRIKQLVIPLLFPVIINVIISLISMKRNIIFYFDINNVYHRGQYFILLPVISFSIIIYSMIYLLINRKKVPKAFFYSFLSFAFWPIIGGLIQTMFYGLPLIFIGMTISIFIIFINIQNEQMYHDYLTGLYNRRQLDLYLQDNLPKGRKNLAGILLDINSFKSINDRYGHQTGDEALRHTSYLLKKSFRNSCFLARLGGDEFVVLMEINDPSDLEQAITKFKHNVLLFNQEQKLAYQLQYSLGAAIYAKDNKMTGQQFLDHIDLLMYQEKRTLTHLD